MTTRSIVCVECVELIASLIQARANCQRSGNLEWQGRHEERLQLIARDILPSGSGIDDGTTIDLDRSTAERIVLHTAFHHMNEHGYYDGWTEHTITVKPAFIGRLQLTISGRNRNEIKEYLHQEYEHVLTLTLIESAEGVQIKREEAPCVP